MNVIPLIKLFDDDDDDDDDVMMIKFRESDVNIILFSKKI